MIKLMIETALGIIQVGFTALIMTLVAAWLSRFVIRQARLAWQEYQEWLGERIAWKKLHAEADTEFMGLYETWCRMREKEKAGVAEKQTENRTKPQGGSSV